MSKRITGFLEYAMQLLFYPVLSSFAVLSRGKDQKNFILFLIIILRGGFPSQNNPEPKEVFSSKYEMTTKHIHYEN